LNLKYVFPVSKFAFHIQLVPLHRGLSGGIKYKTKWPVIGISRKLAGLALTPGVALQVAFERQTLKPVFSLDRL
jgi:hypothetical protein